MTSRPRLYLGSKTAGLGAVALFAVLAYVSLTAEIAGGEGLPVDVSITAGIGYLLFDLPGQLPDGLAGEGFLGAFLLVAFVLDAALGGAVMLATRDEQEAER